MTVENKDKPLDGKSSDPKRDSGSDGAKDDSSKDSVTNHGEGGDEDLDEGGKIDPKKFQQILEDRKAKGKQNQAMKKQLDEQAAIIAKYQAEDEAKKKANLSELEKAKLENEELQKKIATKDLEFQQAQRKLLVVNSGVPAQYQDAVSTMLEIAEKGDKDLDVKKWFEALKEKSPALFDGAPQHEQPKGTAGGPQGRTSAASKTLVELDKKIADALKAGDNNLAFLLNQEKQLIGKET